MAAAKSLAQMAKVAEPSSRGEEVLNIHSQNAGSAVCNAQAMSVACIKHVSAGSGPLQHMVVSLSAPPMALALPTFAKRYLHSRTRNYL